MNARVTSSSQRVGVFVDVQNMFYSAKQLYKGKIDYKKLLKDVVGDRDLIRAIAYVVHKADVNQDSFHGALKRSGYEVKVKKMKVRENQVARTNWNVGLTVDALGLAEKLDVAVLVTGDGCFSPLVEALKINGVKVELFGFERSTSVSLQKAVDEYNKIPESVVFKEKKFERDSREESSGDGMPPPPAYDTDEDIEYDDDEDYDEEYEDEYEEEEEVVNS